MDTNASLIKNGVSDKHFVTYSQARWTIQFVVKATKQNLIVSASSETKLRENDEKKYHTKHTHILNFLLKRGTRANNKTHRDPKQCSHGRSESIVCVCGSCVVHLIAYCRVDSIKCTSTAALVSMFKFNLAPKNSCRVSFFFILLSLYFPFMCMEHDCTLVTVLLLLFASSLPHASIAFCFICCPSLTHS